MGKRILFKLCFFAAAMTVFFTFPLRVLVAGDGSMSPSVCKGDLCIFTQLGDYSLGDVVLYRAGGGTRMGRIAAISGQTVGYSENGYLEIDGAAPLESLPVKTYKAESSSAKFPLEIGDGEFFILNDDRENTEDSRESGAVARSALIGKAAYIYRITGKAGAE